MVILSVSESRDVVGTYIHYRVYWRDKKKITKHYQT